MLRHRLTDEGRDDHNSTALKRIKFFKTGGDKGVLAFFFVSGEPDSSYHIRKNSMPWYPKGTSVCVGNILFNPGFQMFVKKERRG